MPLHRRTLFRLGSAAALAAGAAPAPAPPADHTIRIATSLVELGPDTIVSTTTYNGQFPGPLLRLAEGQQVVVDIHNDTDAPGQLHWHGQFLSPDVDGAAEEGTPFIPPRGMRRIAFTPQPAGFRFYHSHLDAGRDLSKGMYSGEVGLVYVEPRQHPGAYDREVFIVLKEFLPFFTRTEMALDFLAATSRVPELRALSKTQEEASAAHDFPQGYNLGYHFATINGRTLGQGEPVRVRQGERVLFHVLNASASEIHSLALTGHAFDVVALDGNAVANPARVPVLWLGPAERVSAIVEMRNPGVWVMGETIDEVRARGMGIVIEYAGRKGRPQWRQPAVSRWDYRRFARPGATSQPPDEVIELTFSANYGARDGFDEFMINRVAFSMEHMQPTPLVRGRRYRLHLRNATDDTHPIHLHRHSFEITSVAGAPTSGVVKDVAMIGAFQEMTLDFTADQPGLSLLHCHMQHHMDFGFMTLFECS